MAKNPGIWIPAGADVENLKKDLDAAAKAVKDAGGVIAVDSKKMADSTDTATKATKSLQQEFRAASKEAQIAAQRYGQLSTEGLKAAASAGRLKNELDDYRAVEKALASDAPVFTAMGEGLRVATSGFAAAQGAAALFGAENKDVQETLLKVQAAMALTQGIAGLSGAKDAVIALNAAMLANPIAAVAAAVVAFGAAAVFAYNSAEDAAVDLVEVNKKYNDELKQSQDELNKIRNKNISVRELEVRAMVDGKQKEIAMLELQKQKELEAQDAIFQASQQSVYDTIRLGNAKVAIETYYANQRSEVESKIHAKSIAESKKAAEQYIKDQKDAEQAIIDSYKKIEQEEKDSLFRAQMNRALYGPKSKKYEIEVPQLGTKQGIADAEAQNATDKLLKFEATMKEKISAMKETLASAALGAGMATLHAFGEGLVSGEVDLSGIANLMEQIASTLAQSLLAIGAALVLAGPELWGKAAGYFAAAAALQIASGTISALAKGSGGTQKTTQTNQYGVPSAPLPKMADGGILHGPTVFLGGEYPGARSNPEIVTPLDKLGMYLKQMNLGGQGETVVLVNEIRGNDLFLINKRASITKRRM